MNWRPWVVLAVLMAAVVINVALVWFEEVASPAARPELENALVDPLLSLTFTPGQRRGNLERMGLPEDLVGPVAQRIQALESRRRDALKQLLADAQDEIGPFVCPGYKGLPQRYALLAYLVEEQGGERRAAAVDQLGSLEQAAWWGSSLADSVYATVELTRDRKPDATVMGVAAVLLSREDAAIRRESPWGTGLGVLGGWSFDRVVRDHPRLRKDLVEYFAAMHLLVEIANAPEGICS